MPPYVDCYVYVESRAPERVREFLDAFLPQRRELATYYEVPYQGEEVDLTFQSATDLLEYLRDNPEQRHAVYWASLSEGGIRQAIVAPTDDGGTVFGLSCEEGDAVSEREMVARVTNFFGVAACAIDIELPPPASLEEFESACSYR